MVNTTLIAMAIVVAFMIGIYVGYYMHKKDKKKDICGTLLVVHDAIDGDNLILEFTDHDEMERAIRNHEVTLMVVHRRTQ